jgi:signal transduction histidine kinase/CheY-like chemotaxis protein
LKSVYSFLTVNKSYYAEKIDILLVDDRDDNLFSLEAVLACPEYNLIKVNSGADVLRYLLSNTPALILMDVQMPELNGFETATIIKGSERTREIPIIFITAIDKDERFVQEGYEHGAVDYIHKPYDPRILRSKVSVFVEIRRQHRRVYRLVAVQQATTEALAKISDMREAIPEVLKSICIGIGWDFGVFWKFGIQGEKIACKYEWHDPVTDIPGFIKEGLKAEVAAWSGGSALWLNDGTTDGRSPRFEKALKEGLQTMVVVPIGDGRGTLGVLEVYSRARHLQDSSLIKILQAIGSQLDQVIKRTEALERIRANESYLSFLVEASTTLASSLSYEETLSSVAELAVKSLADWCSIYLVEEGQTPRSVIVAHKDPSKLEVVDQLRRKYSPNWNASIGAANVIRTGRSELYSEVTNEMFSRTIIQESDHGLVRELGLKSAMIVPLIGRGKVFGAISLISAESGKTYTPEDLTVAEELARRASMAIDNAMLYREAEMAIRARDEFFSIASHELKTPITSLRLMIQVGQRDLKPEQGKVPSPEKLMRIFDTSTKQVDRLTHLIEDLFDVVRIRAGKLNFQLENVDLSGLINGIVEQYSEGFVAAKCQVELAIEPMVIGFWDRTRIEQVVINLVSNAIKYASGKPIKIELTQRSGIARIVVKDSGPGISMEKQRKIFERFERAVSSGNISGLGLGLFIAKQIVEAHQGHIHIESEEGNGSTFIVDLPRQPTQVFLPTRLDDACYASKPEAQGRSSEH